MYIISIKGCGTTNFIRPDASLIEPYLVYDSKSRDKIFDPIRKILGVI